MALSFRNKSRSILVGCHFGIYDEVSYCLWRCSETNRKLQMIITLQAKRPFVLFLSEEGRRWLCLNRVKPV